LTEQLSYSGATFHKSGVPKSKRHFNAELPISKVPSSIVNHQSSAVKSPIIKAPSPKSIARLPTPTSRRQTISSRGQIISLRSTLARALAEFNAGNSLRPRTSYTHPSIWLSRWARLAFWDSRYHSVLQHCTARPWRTCQRGDRRCRCKLSRGFCTSWTNGKSEL